MIRIGAPLAFALLMGTLTSSAVAQTKNDNAVRMAEVAKTANPIQTSIEDNTAKLESLKAEIHAHQNRIQNLEDEENSTRRSFDDIQQEIALTTELMGQMLERERMLQEQSKLLEGQLGVSIERYDARKRALAKSLRSMYLRQEQSGLEFMASASSFSELVTRVQMDKMLARLEAGLVEQTRSEGLRIQQDQRMLAASLAEIWETREQQLRENDRLENLLAEQSAALRDLETERKGLKSKLIELNLNEQKLAYILEDLDQQRVEHDAMDPQTSNSLVALAGGLDWPVHGEMIRGFGRSVHPRFKTVTLNNGINIAAPMGSPIAAVADGRIEFADDLPGFGRCVILDHGSGYYTLYAYLDRVFVAKGEEIARGQVMAEVGRPSQGEDSQLYFEVRHGRTPLDPTDWLSTR